MTPLDYLGLIASETPWWAYAVLLLLIVLGVRRLKSRVRRLSLAFIAPIAFFVWGLFNVIAYGQMHSAIVGWSILVVMLPLGWVSAQVFSTEQAEPTGDGRFLFHGTPEPLITYMLVFALRFGLEVWTGFQPDTDVVSGGLAIALTALVAGRTAQRAWTLYGMRRDVGVSSES